MGGYYPVSYTHLQQLGFKLVVDPSVNYSGYFDARSRSITMKQIDDSVYHELIGSTLEVSSSFNLSI